MNNNERLQVMENIYYENQGQSTYLVYKMNRDDIIDTVSLGMMMNNKIPGLVDAIVTQVNNDKFVKYNISRKISVKQFFNGVVTKKRFLGVIKGIVKAIESIHDYMIDINLLDFNLEYIYTDVSSYETEMICIPFLNHQKNADVLSLFRNIVFTIQFDQTENCSYIGKIINYLNSTTVFSVEEFKDILFEIDDESSNLKRENSVVNNNLIKKKQIKQKVEIQKQEVNETNQQIKPILNIEKSCKNNKNELELNDEDRISLFYLMQHYNKENLEKFKATRRSSKKKNVVMKKKSNVVPDVAFDIPGVKKANISVNNDNAMTNIDSNKLVENNNSNISIQNGDAINCNNNSQSSVSLSSGNFGDTVYFDQDDISKDTIYMDSTQVENIKEKKVYLIRQSNNEKIEITTKSFKIGTEKSYADYYISNNSAISRSHASIIWRDNNYYVVDTNSTNHTYVNGKMIVSNNEVQIENQTILRFANENFTFVIE